MGTRALRGLGALDETAVNTGTKGGSEGLRELWELGGLGGLGGKLED